MNILYGILYEDDPYSGPYTQYIFTKLVDAKEFVRRQKEYLPDEYCKVGKFIFNEKIGGYNFEGVM